MTPIPMHLGMAPTGLNGLLKKGKMGNWMGIGCVGRIWGELEEGNEWWI